MAGNLVFGMQPRDVLAVMSQAAQRAGEHIQRHAGDVSATRKPDRSLVTQIDIEAQDLIRAHLFNACPHCRLIGEEDLEHRWRENSADDRYCWVIDPLDGTRNYVKGVPLYCVSIALLRDGNPLLALIYDPITDTQYTAIQGEGSFENDVPMRVKDCGWQEDSLIGIPTSKWQNLPPAIRDVWLGNEILRNTGSAALHLAYVARGGLDACYGQKAKLWDIAAGALLVTEAGGAITYPDGSSIFPFDVAGYRATHVPHLAGSPTMHRQLLETLSQ